MEETATRAARQRLIDEFVDETFAGVDPGTPGAGIGERMRRLPDFDAENPGRAAAWRELAGLVGDPAFRARVREMALAGAASTEEPPAYDGQAVITHAGQALAGGVAPGSAAAEEVLGRILPAGLPPGDRARLADQVELFSDRRVERYWTLFTVLAGDSPAPALVPAFEWFAAALRAHG
ncbi:hypothetical protein Sru01_06190 [Sphaerisporangium rufum]|uniref:Uncharacterized protein n=1 Tax=Sphaerisporangium rufum TaxID=1381558 RepID=A0A919R277_9ACTN|nr:hypothetical protein [Sphaerisporangium rufum]GII75637.1 hypothetical protein Sru01_06190 [Sphaerisporangium rufum]